MIHGQLTILRAIEREDLDAIWRWYNDPAVMYYSMNVPPAGPTKAPPAATPSAAHQPAQTPSDVGDGSLAVRLAAAGDLVERARVETDREHDRRDQSCRHSWNWIPSCTPVELGPAGGLVYCTAKATRALCPSRT